MRRGEVYLADVKPSSRGEKIERRAVIVLSHDSFNEVQEWRSVIVVPLFASSGRVQQGPTAVPIARSVGGIEQNSVALCHEVTTIDRSRLDELVGFLPEDTMGAVETGIRAALDL